MIKNFPMNKMLSPVGPFTTAIRSGLTKRFGSGILDPEGRRVKSPATGASQQNPFEVEWFPMEERQLDLIGDTFQKSDGRNMDHPSFTDPVYVQRRQAIGRSSKGYKMSDPIPRVDYTTEETALWGHIYKKVRPLHGLHACEQFNRNIDEFERIGLFSPHRIPQLEELNLYLKQATNWRVKPVNGILSQREFLYCLAFRTFCSTQYIRHPSKPEYTPEPDIMHEFLGHIPNFANQEICEISQLLGILSLGASDEEIQKLAAVYWFTIEFGICREKGHLKFYGAGLAGCVKEILYFARMVREHPGMFLQLDVSKAVPLDLVTQDLQPFYYVAESFEDCIRQLRQYSEQHTRRVRLRHNAVTNSFESDQTFQMKPSFI